MIFPYSLSSSCSWFLSRKLLLWFWDMCTEQRYVVHWTRWALEGLKLFRWRRAASSGQSQFLLAYFSKATALKCLKLISIYL